MQTTQKHTGIPEITVGIDLGDRKSELCRLDAHGGVVECRSIATTPEALEDYFGTRSRARVVLEAGTHSPWISRLLEHLGHEVVVANRKATEPQAKHPSQLHGGKKRSRKKNDRIDAEYLARVARVDPSLLFAIRHRGEETHADLALIHSRDALVRTRASLVTHVRGTVKAFGARLPSTSTPSFVRQVRERIPAALHAALLPVLEAIQTLTGQIKDYDREIERMAAEDYPGTGALRQVTGVGALTALCYVLVIEDATRFQQSRSVGSYLGLTPRLDHSGEHTPELPIAKTGDPLLRRLLVSSAHYILGPFGPDTDLRRWGLALAARGGKNAKKRAVVAVARKLSVLLHRLWSTGEVYEPLRNTRKQETEPGREEVTTKIAA